MESQRKELEAAKSMIENYDMKFKAFSVFFAVSVLFKYLAPFLFLYYH